MIIFPWDRSSQTPTLTGNPPYVIIMGSLNIISCDFGEFKDKVLVFMKEGLDKRVMGGGVHHGN